MTKNTSIQASLILLGLALCTAAVPAQAQITFRAAASTATGVTPGFRAAASAAMTGATLTINKPAGTVANDVMIASIGVTPSTASLTPPAGWILVRRVDNPAATSNSLAVYRKVAGAAEPASYAWGVTGATHAVGGIQAFFNVDTALPIDVENGQATPSALTHSTPSVVTTVPNAMVVTSHTFASSRLWTPPTGMTESFDQQSDVPGATGQSIEGSRVLQAAAGATGAKTATAGAGADAGNAHILALRPATPPLTINKPAGTVANDVMIASIGVTPSTASLTPPAGWILVRRVDNPAATSNSLAVYRKLAGAAEPASYAWGVAGATRAVGGIQAFFNVDTALPIDVENGQATPSALTHSTPSVTTSVGNAMVVTAHTFASSRLWTPPTGMTESFDQQSDVLGSAGQSIEGSRVLQAAGGATGAKTATAGAGADAGNAHILALRPVTVTAAPALYFIHPDHLNTPRVITNQAQQVVWRWDNDDPFGGNMANENPSGLGNFTCNLRFPGQYFDKETNSHYNNARDYSPDIGRYIQSDPIGLSGGINTYLYVGGNPLTRKDPTGLAEGCDFIPDAVENPCRLRCCDRHDQCWRRNRCDLSSWYRFTPRCLNCNLDAIECFIRCNKPSCTGA